MRRLAAFSQKFQKYLSRVYPLTIKSVLEALSTRFVAVLSLVCLRDKVIVDVG